MNGPQHYAAAEKLLQRAGERGEANDKTPVLLARAQVHATLASVAATVEAEALRGWEEVTR